MNACPEDNLFGPIAIGCRDNFDFTLLFEQSIFSIVPSVIFLLFVPLRLIKLLKGNVKTVPNVLSKLTVLTSLVLVGLQLGLLVAWSKSPATRASIPAATLSFIDSLAILGLTGASPRNVRPISLLSLYLLVSLLVNPVELRTLYLRKDPSIILGLSTAAFTAKLVLLLLETRNRRKWLRAPYRGYSREATSGVINRGLFWWVNPLMTTGFRKILSLDDLYTADPSLESETLEKQMRMAWTKYEHHKSLALLRACLYCFRWRLLAFVFPRFLLIGFNYAQPFLISQLVRYVDLPPYADNNKDGYLLIGTAALVYIGVALASVHYQHKLFRAVTMFRGAAVAMVYSKSLELSTGAYDEGAALTLMSADIERIVMGFETLSQIWAYVIEIVIGVVLLERQVGWISFAPVLIVAGGVYGSILISRYVVGAQKAWMQAIQSRIAITSPALNSMKAIKMMGLSRILVKKLQDYRINELNLSAQFRQLSTWRLTLMTFSSVAAPFVVFVVYAIQASVLHTGGIGASQAFTALAIITLLTGPAGSLLQAIPQIGICHGCLSRIEAYLRSGSWQDDRKDFETVQSQSASDGVGQESSKIAISAQSISLRPIKTADLAIHDFTFEATVGSLVMIVGPVGSGKTTLLRGLLGDIDCISGSIHVRRREMAYCSQTTWLPNGTIREIVSGGQDNLETDHEWYTTTIRACDLEHDIQQLSDGHDTIIGTRGVALSGGQKQRLALARAVYSRKNVLLLDDILSALDSKTEQRIIDNLLGKNGLLHKMGATVIMAGHAWRPMHLADNIIVLTKDGHIQAQGTWTELRKNGTLGEEFMQSARSLDTEPSLKEVKPVPKALKGASANDIADLNRQTGDVSLYFYYGKTIGPKLGSMILAGIAFNAVTSYFPQIWIKWYSTGTITGDGLFCGVYFLLVVVALGAMYLSTWTYYCLGIPKSGARLHEILLKTTFNAPQSFFDKTDAGVTLNRFSQDMSLVDGPLPVAALITLQAAMNCIVLVAFIASGSSYMGLTIPLLLLALYALQKLYLRTSRQIRFLDIESKAPLYSHFVETIEGLSTIRAYGWQPRFSSEFRALLDTSQKPYYMLFCIQRWLNLALGLITGAMAVSVIALAIAIRSSTNPGSLGVALNGVLSLDSTFQYLMLFWTSLETSLGAISRTRSFEKDTPTEVTSAQTLTPPSTWPSSGKIGYTDLEAKYTNLSETPALAISSLILEPSTRAGIIGRTGSGKSTMLSITTGLLPLSAGEILIDDLPISQIPVDILRERIITIPQDAFVLPGLTVRENADLASNANDETVVSALQKVGLWDKISARGGLDAQMPGLSQGESQVFALVRALVRRKADASRGILLLDEATSNTDRETDERMSSVITQEFAGWTVIMIAHRLESVQRMCDTVVKLDSGKIVRVGDTQSVLAEEGMANAEDDGK